MARNRQTQDLLAELLALANEVQNGPRFVPADDEEPPLAIPVAPPARPIRKRTVEPAPQPQAARADLPKAEPLPEHCVIPHQKLTPPQIARPNHLSINLRRRNNLKQAIILAEILDRPRAYDI